MVCFEAFTMDFNRKPDPGEILGMINDEAPSTLWRSLTAVKPYDPPFQYSDSSLAMCTETLGSETGSEEYFPASSSDTCETDVAFVALRTTRARLAPRNFPPPLSSLGGHDGPCLVMKSVRDNGRLVVEAVPVERKHNFKAERQNGRLILSLMKEESGTPEGEQIERSELQTVKISLGMPRMVITGELLLIRKPLVNRRWGDSFRGGETYGEEDEDGGRRKEIMIWQYLAALQKGCKDQRPSLTAWEPRCIATI